MKQNLLRMISLWLSTARIIDLQWEAKFLGDKGGTTAINCLKSYFKDAFLGFWNQIDASALVVYSYPALSFQFFSRSTMKSRTNNKHFSCFLSCYFLCNSSLCFTHLRLSICDGLFQIFRHRGTNMCPLKVHVGWKYSKL